MEPVLVAEGVRKTYGETVALDGVSLSVEAGEVVVLVGPNGAGKTTLVRALTGTTEPDDGRVRVLGSPPGDVDRSALGVLPQAFAPPSRLTARELLGYFAGLYDAARNPTDVLREVGLSDAADTRYEALSGGQQRRVCLGTALVNEPSVLVLDEPTTGIDPAGRRRVRELVATLADGGATVLVTTHDMDEAERLADRVVLLADGRVRATGSPAQLVRDHGGPARVEVALQEATSRDALDVLVDAGYEVPDDRAGGPSSDGEYGHVRGGRRRSETVVVSDVEPEAVVGVAEALDAAGLEYEGIVWRRPSLEDAYLALADGGVLEERVAAQEHRNAGSQRGSGGDRR